MKIPFSPPAITEGDIAAVTSVLRSGWITTGRQAARLEEMLSGMMLGQQVVALGSCTAAMILTLRVLEIGPGDEVITSPYTYTATAAAILHVGARPVFADVLPGTYAIDPCAVLALLGPRTKAVIAVDVGGVPCDYDALRQVLQDKGGSRAGWFAKVMGRPALIADAAHSLGGARGTQPVGSLADFTCFSFHAVKNLTTAEGGAVTWRALGRRLDEQLTRRFRLWSLHGQNRSAQEKERVGGWNYDIELCGEKCNLPDVLAALGVSQLERYYETLSCRRQMIALYEELLGARVELLPHWGEGWFSSCHLCMMQVNPACRDSLLELLAAWGIGGNVHFRPLPLMTAYRKLGYSQGDCPVAVARYLGEISLPLFNAITPQQVEQVATAVLAGLDRLEGRGTR